MLKTKTSSIPKEIPPWLFGAHVLLSTAAPWLEMICAIGSRFPQPEMRDQLAINYAEPEENFS